MPTPTQERLPVAMPRTASRIRVLVVDDSVVIRRMVTRMLTDDPAFDVIGFAADGASALVQAAALKPDVITMDIEMPVLDGLSAVRELRARGSKAVVIMCSALTSLGGKATIQALVLGANDYVTKSDLSASNAVETLQAELKLKIKQFFPTGSAVTRPLNPIPTPAPPKAPPLPITPRTVAQPRSILAIGVSTGGPTALMRLIPALPTDFPVPIVIVQHMPPVFTEQLALRLNTESRLEVVEASEGMPLAPGRVIVAAGDWHLRLKRSGAQVVTTLDQGERENSCRPSVDVLFHSVAETYAGRVVALMLTGMGQDGLRGTTELKQRGALILAQDRQSSVVWGMPGAIVEAGLADAVLDLEDIAPRLVRQEYMP